MSFVFPPYGDVGPPLMATLSLPGLTIGLPVWLFSSPTIPCTPVASDPNPSLQEPQPHVDPSPSSLDDIFIFRESEKGLKRTPLTFFMFESRA